MHPTIFFLDFLVYDHFLWKSIGGFSLRDCAALGFQIYKTLNHVKSSKYDFIIGLQSVSPLLASILVFMCVEGMTFNKFWYPLI